LPVAIPAAIPYVRGDGRARREDGGMRIIKWTFWGLVWALFLAFLHYTLPRHDVVRITDTYETRVDYGNNALFWSNAATGNDPNVTNRDVFFIQAIDPDGNPRIYRNEDTGWGWPPYFKFNTANLQAAASDYRSTRGAPQWVAVRHYGWRNELLSIFPNAVSIRPVEGPDARVIPWTAIVILVLIAALVWGVTVRWRRFKARRLSPVLDEVDAAFDERWIALRRWADRSRRQPPPR